LGADAKGLKSVRQGGEGTCTRSNDACEGAEVRAAVSICVNREVLRSHAKCLKSHAKGPRTHAKGLKCARHSACALTGRA